MEELLISSMRLSIPLIFAAYGGLLCERSGVANLSLEGLLLFSAFASAATTALTGHLEIGILAGILGSLILSCLFAWICVVKRADQIVTGTAINILVTGLIPLLNKFLFSVTGATPSLPAENRFSKAWVFFGLALFLMMAYQFVFSKTRHGLRLWAAGENPLALSTQGVSPHKVRIWACVEGSVWVGIGGIYLSLCQSSGYVRNMSAGRGFIALAALILGGWKPIPTFCACLLFGFTDAIQIRLQGTALAGWIIPTQFIQIFPYVATLLGLALLRGRMRAPRAINQ